MTDRFVSPCPPPEPYQAELLHKLIEECSEVQKRATKALRFGLDEIQPGQEETNRDRIEGEVLYLMATLEALGRTHVIHPVASILSPEIMEKRLARIRKYMQTDMPDGVGF